MNNYEAIYINSKGQTVCAPKEYQVHATTFNNYFLVTRFGLPVSDYFNTRKEAQVLADKLNV